MLDKKLGEFLNASKSYNILYQKSLRNDLKIIVGDFHNETHFKQLYHKN